MPTRFEREFAQACRHHRFTPNKRVPFAANRATNLSVFVTGEKTSGIVVSAYFIAASKIDTVRLAIL